MKTLDCIRDVQTGLRRGRSERKPEAYLLCYVEGLSEARTKREGCFNILHKVARHV